MNGLLRDFRFAGRELARRPWLNGLAVLSLALGIGANTALFSVIDAVLWRGASGQDDERLAQIYFSDSSGFAYATFSVPDYLDIRRSATSFEQIAAQQMGIASSPAGERSELLFGEEVSANYFDLWGGKPQLGRSFLSSEDEAGTAAAVVILGESLWRRRFGGDPGVVGQSLTLNGQPFTVIGVAPEGFKGTFSVVAVDYFIPLAMSDRVAERPRLEQRGARSLFLRGRLKPGISPQMAEAELGAIAARLAAAYPDTNEGRKVRVVPAEDVALNPGLDKPLKAVAALLMTVVGLVLLIACSNIANLLLARASDRGREIALRLALGSGRFRLIRQLLAESFLLAAMGGVAGLGVALLLAQLLVRATPDLPIPLVLDVSLDGRVLLFTLVVAVVTGLACGLAPARSASRADLVTSLKGGEGGLASGRRRFTLRNMLVVGQVAVSTLVLIGGGLFLRSLGSFQKVDPGFSLRDGVMVQLAPGIGNRLSEEQGRVYYRQVVERLSALPGVRSAAIVGHLPLGANVHVNSMAAEGEVIEDWDQAPAIDTVEVGSGYFRTLGIELVAGRDFGPGDSAEAPRVVILNQTAAQQHFPGISALGKRVRFGEDEPWHEVIGVAADGKYRTLGESPRPFVYRAHDQDWNAMAGVVVAVAGDASSFLGPIRRTVEEIDREVPIFELKTLSEHLAFMLFPARMGALILGLLGLLGILLAAVGIYGVVAYSVARRRREVGIRMAVGAETRDVVRLVVGEGMRTVGLGLGIGILLALAASQLLRQFLFGIDAMDPLTFVFIPTLITAVALVANFLPARTAARVAPSETLRSE
ncbi:MAG TPA: ABC transporter permease [Thermoanaerobaculia bacterium]|nr:ABC transporter permease [Thermoanaerobaculia bacterium]